MASKGTPVVQFALEEHSPFIEKLMPDLKRKVEREIRQGGALIRSSAVGKAPSRTSNLANSGVVQISGSELSTQAEVIFRAPYAGYVHEGTGIHGPGRSRIVIRPKRKMALYWAGAEHPVKKVVNPGQEAQPFLRKAFDEEGPKILAKILE